jgi:hypothetical protein
VQLEQLQTERLDAVQDAEQRGLVGDRAVRTVSLPRRQDSSVGNASRAVGPSRPLTRIS